MTTLLEYMNPVLSTLMTPLRVKIMDKFVLDKLWPFQYKQSWSKVELFKMFVNWLNINPTDNRLKYVVHFNPAKRIFKTYLDKVLKLPISTRSAGYRVKTEEDRKRLNDYVSSSRNV